MSAQAAITRWLASPWMAALLTGLLTFVALMILNAWHVAPHSLWRGAVVGGASGALVTYLMGRAQKRSRKG